MNEQANETLSDSTFNDEEIEEQINEDKNSLNIDDENDFRNNIKNYLVDNQGNLMNSKNIDHNYNEINSNKENTTLKTEKNKIVIPKIRKKNEILNDELNFLTSDTFLFNGKPFRKNNNATKYITKDKIKREIYKCKYNRHEEKLRKSLKKKCFCNATIEYIYPNQNKKSGYFLKEGHSVECEDQFPENKIFNEQAKTNKNNDIKKENFILECNNVMNSSTIYDRGLFKDKFKEIYNKNSYKFPINNVFLSNIITKWKNSSNRFNKACVWENANDYENRLILRDFRIINDESDKNNKNNNYEYIIWANDENIKRIRKSNHLYIDCTFHHPKEFKQLLIIMYKDIITDLKIPGMFILLNGKSQFLYDYIFNSVINIITNNRKIDLNILSIVSDSEKALINSIKKFFPNSLRISCYFHYKQDLIRNIKLYGLYKKKDKDISNKIIQKLSNLPFEYNGDMNIINQRINSLIKKYPLYENYINNYFKVNKYDYFEDLSLDYNRIPHDCRTNNYLENYNGYIKKQLGKNRIINWVNFIHFIKLESRRSIEKLTNTDKQILKLEFKSNGSEDKMNLKEEQNVTEQLQNINNEINNNIKIIKTTDYINIIHTKIGIINLKASCYINSFIQVLIHCKSFMDEFLKRNNLFVNNNYSLSNKILRICKDMLSEDIKINIGVDISYFYYLFSVKHENFGGLIQQDCHEFILFLLDDLSKEFNETKRLFTHRLLCNDDSKTKQSRYQEYIKLCNEKEKSFVSDLIYSTIIQSYICECSKEIYAFQNYMDLPLLLPDNIDRINIIELLDNYFNSENIMFDEICDKCKKKTIHKKTVKIARETKILVLTLQRLDILNNIKNDIYVDFAEKLDIKKYIDLDIEDKNKFEYELYAVIFHEGELKEGHYYSVIKPYGQDYWYEFNDNIVKKLRKNLYNTDNAYILFYILKD